jgi:acyl-CoA synthetase (AMP-forming)/AMP-acid ligase II
VKGAPFIEPQFTTLNQMLAATAQSELDLTFVNRREQDLAVPMARIYETALSIAADLVDRGVQKGDRVAIVLPTCPEFVQSFFGVLYAGAVPVPLYPPFRLGRLDEYHQKTAAMLSAVGATLVVTDERIRRLLGVAVERSAPRLGCVTASKLGGSKKVEIDVSAGDLALIQFSSGSTSDPKPVALTHANLLANLAAISQYCEYEGTPDPMGVTWLPLYHDMGLIGNLLLALYVPAPLVLIPPEMFLAVPGAWLRAISRHGGTHTTAPNFAFGLCLNRIRDDELDGVDLSSWRICLNGAELISAAVQRRFVERFGQYGFNARALTPAYGMSEASLAVTFKRAGEEFRTVEVDGEKLAAAGVVEPGSREVVGVGVPVAGVEIVIRDNEGQSLESGRVGHIHVRGPNVMAEYFGRADLTDQVIHSGWLDTGDLGFELEGELFVCGRHKDVVIVRGANHSPQDFEAALDGLPGVRAGCAVAVGFVPEGADDEALAMLVEITSDASTSLACDVTARVEKRTRIRPAHVELLAPGTLPRTSSGKMRRREARAQWLAGTLAPPKKVSVMGLLIKATNGEVFHTRASLARHRAAKQSSMSIENRYAEDDHAPSRSS